MMYHFMFGFFGASMLAVPSAAAAWGSLVALVATSFFSSSCIFKLLLPSPDSRRSRLRFPLVNPEITEHCRNGVLDDEVDDPEVQREDEYRNDDDGSRRANFFQRRCRHLAHLRAHFVIERPNFLRPGFQPLAKAANCN